jgi:hypothetical protein
MVLAQHWHFSAVHGFDVDLFRLAWFTHGDGADIPRWRPLRHIQYICDNRVATDIFSSYMYT